MNYWIAKTEPEAFSFDDLVRDQECIWDGVRNYQARNNLKAMELGDKVLIYHSVSDKEIVGLAEVSETAFQDPTTEDPNWFAVKMKPVQKFSKFLSLAAIKADPVLSQMLMVRNSRLSVVPIQKEEFDLIIELTSNIS